MPQWDLRSLQDKVIGQVVLFDDGVAHDVHAMNGTAIQLLNADEDSPAIEKVNSRYRCVEILCPSLSADDVRSLVPDVVAQIIAIASGGIAEVEQTNPNGDAPTTGGAAPSQPTPA